MPLLFSQEGSDSEWFLVSIGASAVFSRGKGFRVVPSKHWYHCCFLKLFSQGKGFSKGRDSEWFLVSIGATAVFLREGIQSGS